MSRYAIAFFLLFLGLSVFGAEKPFWEKKPKDLAKRLQNRKIPVSVKSKEISDNKHHLRMQGIGETSAPFHYTKKWTANFDNLLRVSTYARAVSWNPISRRLFLHTEAFGFHARMRMKVNMLDEKEARSIHFEVIEGVFTGMKGNLKVQKASFATSYVSIDANYFYSKWTIPKLFLEFGLEVVLQKFAERLRALMEEDFKEGRPVVKTQ